jgi:hypothetical protein
VLFQIDDPEMGTLPDLKDKFAPYFQTRVLVQREMENST